MKVGDWIYEIIDMAANYGPILHVDHGAEKYWGYFYLDWTDTMEYGYIEFKYAHPFDEVLGFDQDKKDYFEGLRKLSPNLTDEEAMILLPGLLES